MGMDILDFEAPLAALQKEIESLTGYPADAGKEREIARLSTKLDEMRREIYSKLTPWQTVQVARHSQRPYVLDFIEHLFTDFVEVQGDRRFGKTRPSSPAWRGFTTNQSPSSATKKDATRSRKSSAISGCRGQKAIGKHSA